MKVRTGFVSNSSSSSFIVRKSALTDNQLSQLKAFIELRKDWYETEMYKEDHNYLWSDVEAHNAAYCSDAEEADDEEINPNDSETASDLLIEMMEDFDIGRNDFSIRYEEYISPENIGGSLEGWTGETYEN